MPLASRPALFLTLFVSSAAFADAAPGARQLLDELVAIDTSNPPGNEAEAARVIAARLTAAGLKPELFPFAPGRANVVTRLRGDGKKRPLILLAHLDVVGAAGQPWTVPPFHVTEKDGWLYGRGVIDDKGWATVALSVFLELAHSKAHLHRDVILALTGDEESGGAGVRDLLEHHPTLLGDAEIALNEGGGLKLDEQGRVVLVSFQAAEKVFQSYQLTAHGLGGHSSVPNDENAIYRLAHAIDQISRLKFAPRLTPTVRDSLRAIAADRPEPRAAAMRALAASQNNFTAETLAAVDSYPLTRAIIRTTCVATELSGGTRENALPVEAKATVNCRVMPVDKLDDVQRALADAVGDSKVEIKPVGDMGVGPEISIEGAVPSAIRKVAKQQFGGSVGVTASVGLGATDSRFLRKAGILSYGVGVLPKPEELIRQPHGPDEGVPATSVAAGVRWLSGLVHELAQ